MSARTAQGGRSPERREQLLQAADRAIDALGPGVRMEDIAAEAGITKPVIYRHFGDKGGLYEAIARRFARELQDRLEVALDVEGDPREQLRTVIGAFLTAIEERPALYRFLLHRAAAERPEVSQAAGDFTHELARRIAVVLDTQFARYDLRLGHPELVAHGLIGMVHQVSDWWLVNDGIPRDDLRDLLVRMVWAGLPAVGIGDLDVARTQWRREPGGR